MRALASSKAAVSTNISGTVFLASAFVASTFPTNPTKAATTVWSRWSSRCSQQKKQAAASGQSKEIAARKCAALDCQIDDLVYQLYGLTPDEIALVEGATA
ncbi:MAG: hypothetical protein ABIY40_00490 [Rhodanobacteraceae bacterium]